MHLMRRDYRPGVVDRRESRTDGPCIARDVGVESPLAAARNYVNEIKMIVLCPYMSRDERLEHYAIATTIPRDAMRSLLTNLRK